MMKSDSNQNKEKYNQQCIENSHKNNKTITNEVQYHKTLLIACFLGIFGIHRIISKRTISGLAMLLLSLISITIIFLVRLKYDFSSIVRPIYYSIIYVQATFSIWVLSVWRVVDIILIMSGRFKVEKGKSRLRSGKTFFRTWSNILVIIIMMISIIFNVINIRVITSYLIEAGVNIVHVEDPYADYVKTFAECFQKDEFFYSGDIDNFVDESERFLIEKDYLVESDESGIVGTKEVTVGEEEVQLQLEILHFKPYNDVHACYIDLEMADGIKISNNFYTNLIVEFDYNGANIKGSYNVKDEKYDLYYNEDCKLFCENYVEYDLKEDELEIKKLLDQLMEIYLNEIESFMEFDKT